MSVYKQCKCVDKNSCAHSWWGQSRGKRVSLTKWARKLVNGSKTEAQKVFDLFAASVLQGTSHQGMRPESYTTHDLVGDYLETYFLPRGREYDKKEKYRFEAIKKKFGGVLPGDLTTVDVERWVNELRRKGKSAATIRRYTSRLKAILNWGYERELFPVLRIRWRALELDPESEGRARRLEEGEEERLKAAASPWLRQLIEAALDTGLRAGALLGLTFGMVNGTTLVVPRKLLKNKRATHDLKIPLTSRLQAIIEFRQCGPHGEKLGAEQFIFGTTWGRQRKDFRGAWDTARKGAGVPRVRGSFDLRWHDLRGEFATRLHEAGVPIETVSYLLDHSTIEMTRRYIKLRTRSKKPAEAIKALEEFQAAFAKGEEQQPGAVH